MNAERGRKAVAEWLRHRAGGQGGAVIPVTPSEAEHSALLLRLLGGKRALPHPPPLAYGYPAYDLFDDPYVDLTFGDVHEYPGRVDLVVIRQTVWRVETIIEDGFVVTHEQTPGILWVVERRTGLNALAEPTVGWHMTKFTP